MFITGVISNDSANGLSWNESTNTLNRTGSLIGFANGITPGNNRLPIHSEMKGCTLLDSGNVNYYLSATDWSKKEDGATNSNLTGADGQIMVQIPKFWYKYSYVGKTHYWSISNLARNDYIVHPAFIKDGIEVNYRYISAYEAVLYDMSVSGYTDGNVGQVKNAAEDKLSSVTGKIPTTLSTRANMRKMASNRGTGWRQLDYDLLQATQLLFMIEYASLDAQAAIGAGVTYINNWPAYNNNYPFVPTGNGNIVGNGTFNTGSPISTTCAAEISKYVKYRGIEQWWGHLFKWVDGINFVGNVPWVSNNSSNWSDGSTTNYVSGQTLANQSGYPTSLIPNGRFLLPLTVDTTGPGYIPDWYNASSGSVVVNSGGAWQWEFGGPFYYFSYSSFTSQDTTARLCF
jgi:YHS domain-containing protein